MQTKAPKVVPQILRYFGSNPGAADTLEGIARWRLLEEQISRSVKETQLAVEWLVAEGYLLEESRVSSGTLYRLNPEKTAEVASFLTRNEKKIASEANQSE